MNQPPQAVIDHALYVAAWSPCAKSKRGVVVWCPVTGNVIGDGFNGPPRGFECLGREACRGTCSLRCVHAEMRALEDARAEICSTSVAAELARRVGAMSMFDLLHVELSPDGGIVACNGPECAQCSKHIVDSEFIGRVWLYVAVERYDADNLIGLLSKKHRIPSWVSYTPEEFHRLSLQASGAMP